jgi:predicted transcriptional regulator
MNEEQKAAMKALRRERKTWVQQAAAKVKEHKGALRDIRTQLRETPRTVPEIAEGTHLSPSKVMWYVASMKKFGEILEADQDGSYFRYRLASVDNDGNEESDATGGDSR